MAEQFDPYYKWLGIPPEEQPPSHYRLLGLRDFESDPEVIEAAADRQMGYVRIHQAGRHSDISQKLLNEIASARVCLLNPAKKVEYDAQLRERQRPRPAPAGRPVPVTTAASPGVSIRTAPAIRPRRSRPRARPQSLVAGALTLGVLGFMAIVLARTLGTSTDGEGIDAAGEGLAARGVEQPISDPTLPVAPPRVSPAPRPEIVAKPAPPNPAPDPRRPPDGGSKNGDDPGRPIPVRPSGDSPPKELPVAQVPPTPPPLPAEGQGLFEASQDIGAPRNAGGTVHADGAYTVRGGGGDIFFRSDQFHFAYRRITGDCEIVARLVSLEEWGIHGKAGVMLRQSLAPDSGYAMVSLEGRAGASFQFRPRGMQTVVLGNVSARPPQWIKLVRKDNLFFAYHSPDGKQWTRIGDNTLNIVTDEVMYAGLAVTSQGGRDAAVAVFDNVSVKAAVPDRPPPPLPAGPVAAGPVRRDALVAWWKMGEEAVYRDGNWIVPDASGNGHTATSVNMEEEDRVAGCPFAGPAGPSYAMEFDGQDEYFEVAYHKSLAMESSFTLSAWVRPDRDARGDRVIVGRDDRLQLRHNYNLQLNDRYLELVFFVSGMGWPKCRGSTLLGPDRWHYVVGVFDDQMDLKTVYIDGSEAGREVMAGRPEIASQIGPGIGANAGEKKRFFHGAIDDVRIYNAALSAEEVAAIYNGGRGDLADGAPAVPATADRTSSPPPPPPDPSPRPPQPSRVPADRPVRRDALVAWWKMGEEAVYRDGNWIVPDASGNGHTATSVNMEEEDRVAGCPFAGPAGPSYAMEFDMMREYLEVPHDAALVFGSSFTLSAWVRGGEKGESEHILVGRLDRGLRHNYCLQLGRRRVELVIGAERAGWPKCTGRTSLNDDAWRHVAGIFDDDGDEMRVFVDGRLDGTLRVPHTPQTGSTHGVSIAANAPEGNRWFHGTIDDVRIYNAALSAEEVAAICNGGRGDLPPAVR